MQPIRNDDKQQMIFIQRDNKHDDIILKKRDENRVIVFFIVSTLSCILFFFSLFIPLSWFVVVVSFVLYRRSGDVVLMRKVAGFNHKIFTFFSIVSAIGIVISAYLIYTYEYHEEMLIFSFLAMVCMIGYRYLNKEYFLEPFLRNDDLFLKKRKEKSEELSIYGMDKMRHYSTADELKKWVELRDSGAVSEEDFEIMRSKILKKD